MNAKAADTGSGPRGMPSTHAPIPLDFRAPSCLHMGRDRKAKELAAYSQQGGTEP